MRLGKKVRKEDRKEGKERRQERRVMYENLEKK